MTAIVTEQLSKRYGDQVAVDGLSFEVAEGEVFGLLGPNGAGKTTTVAMLLGLVRPTSGRAWLLGHDVQTSLAAALRSVGAMIEAPAFYPYLTGRNNLCVLAALHGVSNARVEAVLRQVDLHNAAQQRFANYSQGMKQRLAIAGALLHEPRLVILDEPTNGLDPLGVVEMRELIRALARDGRTVLLCSHTLPEVEQLCGRVAILHRGRLAAHVALDELRAQGKSLEAFFLQTVAP